MTAALSDELIVSACLSRRDPDTGRAYDETFVVRIPRRDHVLNLLAAIRREHDPTLSYPAHFCKLGTCGACALVVDGAPSLGCRVLVEIDCITIGPPKGRRVLADLLTSSQREKES